MNLPPARHPRLAIPFFVASSSDIRGSSNHTRNHNRSPRVRRDHGRFSVDRNSSAFSLTMPRPAGQKVMVRIQRPRAPRTASTRMTTKGCLSTRTKSLLPTSMEARNGIATAIAAPTDVCSDSKDSFSSSILSTNPSAVFLNWTVQAIKLLCTVLFSQSTRHRERNQCNHG